MVVLGTVTIMKTVGGRGHCLIRQLKDTSAEEIKNMPLTIKIC